LWEVPKEVIIHNTEVPDENTITINNENEAQNVFDNYDKPEEKEQ
jgi:hypothetical protein